MSLGVQYAYNIDLGSSVVSEKQHQNVGERVEIARNGTEEWKTNVVSPLRALRDFVEFHCFSDSHLQETVVLYSVNPATGTSGLYRLHSFLIIFLPYVQANKTKESQPKLMINRISSSSYAKW